MSFPPNKTFKELGLDPNATFRVVSGNGYFEVGDLVRLFGDDETSCPKFKRIIDGKIADCLYSRLEYATPPVKTFETLEIADEVEDREDKRYRYEVLDFSLNKQIAFISGIFQENNRRSFILGLAKQEFEKQYKIIQPEPPKEEVQEMTMADVEKLVGKKVKIVKEKQ